MATSKTDIIADRPTLGVWDIIFDAQADVTLVFAHGLAATPDVMILCPLLPAHYLNSLHVSAIDATNVTITGANVAGSENAAAQARLTLMAPHTIM